MVTDSGFHGLVGSGIRRIMSNPRYAIPLAALAVLPASAQFTAVNSGLPEPPRPCAAWGDYDNDGDLDALIAGEGRQGTVSSAIYRNTAGSFSNSGVSLLGLESADAAWGDFDNDGDLDLAMTGLTNGGAVTTRVYRNNLTTFTAIAGPFQNLFAGQIAWIDTDGDGDLDLFYTGVNSTSPTLGQPFTRLYRNDAGTFTAATHPFGNFGVGGFAWEDYDRDGDPDLLITGSEVPGSGCPLWRNDGGAFTKVPSGLPDTGIGFLEWGDYDSDGDSDLLFGGDSDDGWISRIYRNDAGIFVNINAPLVAVIWSSAKWGDYDNDGDLDAMVIGSDPVEGVPVSKLYRNDAGSFIDSGAVLHEAWLGLTNWADYDGDGDLDLLIAGNSEGGDHLTLYRNDVIVHDTAPGPPLNPLATVAGNPRHAGVGFRDRRADSGRGADIQRPDRHHARRLGNCHGPRRGRRVPPAGGSRQCGLFAGVPSARPGARDDLPLERAKHRWWAHGIRFHGGRQLRGDGRRAGKCLVRRDGGHVPCGLARDAGELVPDRGLVRSFRLDPGRHAGRGRRHRFVRIQRSGLRPSRGAILSRGAALRSASKKNPCGP